MSIEKPEIDFPEGEPPADLEIKDIWEGDGAEATPGPRPSSTTSASPSRTGEEFDASWNRGTPLRVPARCGQVIAGWDQGVQGMKVGGRRQLIHPGAPRVRRPRRRRRSSPRARR